MKNQLVLASLLAATGAASALSPANPDTARVVRVTPRVEQVAVSREVCPVAPRSAPVAVAPAPVAETNVGGAILGTVVGGVIGSRFGGGDGRLAATAVGAGIGAVVGANSTLGQSAPAPNVIQPYAPTGPCRVETFYEPQQRGFEVVYEYAGREYATVMPYDPGRRLRVNVSVTPAE